MARFTPQKFNLGDINGGERFQNGQEPQEDAFNAPIEGSAYAIELAEDALIKADQAINSIIPTGGTYPPLTAYPIGSVYISTISTSPAILFGGSWVQVTDRFLVGAGKLYSLGETGGSADAVVVSHHHTGLYYNAISQDRELSADKANGQQVSSGGNITRSSDIQGTNRYVTGEVGVDGTGKNIPPYLAVFMWKRIA